MNTIKLFDDYIAAQKNEQHNELALLMYYNVINQNDIISRLFMRLIAIWRAGIRCRQLLEPSVELT